MNVTITVVAIRECSLLFIYLIFFTSFTRFLFGAGAWTNIFKELPLASSEVSSAIECYHNQLKLRLLNEKNSNIYQRADWLVDKLGTKVHSYYWLDEYSGKANFSRYWKDEWKCGLTTWRQALEIPDSDVVFYRNSARVVHRGNPGHVHIILNPGSEFAICDCSWSKMGNLCEHVIKSSKIYRDNRSNSFSTSMFEYKRTLMNVLQCPPHSSLIRDHAISWAASVQVVQEFCSFNTGKSILVDERVADEHTSIFNKASDDANEVSDDNQGAPLNNFDVLQSVNHPPEDFNTAADTRDANGIAGTLMQSSEHSSAALLAAEEQISVGHSSENLSSEGRNLDSPVFHQLLARGTTKDSMLINDNINEIAINTAFKEDVADGNENAVAEKMKESDQSSMECLVKCGTNFLAVHQRAGPFHSLLSKNIEPHNVDVSCAPRKPSAFIVVTENCSIGENMIGIASTMDNSFCDANGLGASVMSTRDPPYHDNGVAYCARIKQEPSADFSQASVVIFDNADVKVCMDIDLIRSDEKVCDNDDNMEVY